MMSEMAESVNARSQHH